MLDVHPVTQFVPIFTFRRAGLLTRNTFGQARTTDIEPRVGQPGQRCVARRVRPFRSKTCLTHSPFGTISRLE